MVEQIKIEHFSVREDLSDFLIVELSFIDKDEFPTPWGERAWSEILTTQQFLSVMMIDNKIVGFSLFELSRGDSFAHLVKLVIRPPYRAQGLASKLLGESLKQLELLKFSRFFLEVESSNLGAISLYKKLGFALLNTKKGFYGPNRDAFAMERIIINS